MVNLDNQAFFFINKICMCPVLDRLMLIATRLGGGELIFIASLILLVFARRKEKKLSGVLLLAGLTIEYQLVSLLKSWFARPRPFIALSEARLVGGATSGFSFPSGHTTLAFMAAVVLSKYFKRPGLFFGVAALVAVSRVYLGVHYPTDVLSGAALGSIIGYALVRVVESKGSDPAPRNS